MRKILLFIIFTFSVFISFSQSRVELLNKNNFLSLNNDKSVILSKRDSIKSNLSKTIKRLDKRKYMKLTPGLRFMADYLDDYDSNDIEFIEALEELVKYVRNDSVREMSEYLMNYIQNSSKRELALKKVKDKFRIDSLHCESFKNLNSKHDRDSLEKLSFKLEELDNIINYIEQDSSYQWIKKISRDSVLLSLKNNSNDSLNIWVKNGRRASYRFWIKNAQNDSIGAWIQTTKSKGLRIIVDHDVYQESMSDKTNVIKQMPIMLIDSSLYNMGKLYPYKRRYTKWRYASIVNIGLSQGKLANWQEDGENSISGLLDIKAFCNYKFSVLSWENTINYRYGMMKAGDEPVKKTEDLIEVNTKMGHQFYKNWYFTTMFNLKTQMTNGYNYLDDNSRVIVSKIMSPGYLLCSFGFDYKPSDKLSILMSPFTGKYSMVLDTLSVDPTKYGIKKGESVKREIGAYAKLMNKITIVENVKLDNEFGMFYSYEANNKEIDIDWKTSLEMKVNYFITTKIFTHILYDKTVSKKFQFKEVLNFGVTYHF